MPEKHVDAPTSLPRELLRWLSTLDLKFPVKNPRRSLSNGYLIAEILARYFPKHVPLHGFDTGIGGRSKTRNWQLLHKIFSKLEINVPNDTIADTIKEIPGAVDWILSTIYRHVHGHTTYQGAKPSSPSNIPVDHVISTSAAADLLGLASIPPTKIFVWHLFNEVTGINDWAHVDSHPELFDDGVILNKVLLKDIQFSIAFKTDSKPNILHLVSFLWSAFRFEESSLPFTIATQLLTSFSRHLMASQAQHVRDTVVHGMDALLPLDQLPLLHQKLGTMSRIIAIYLARPASPNDPTSGIDLTILGYFKTQLSPPLAARFFAGLGTYPGDAEFWHNEVDLVIRNAEQRQDTHLARSAIPLVGSVGKCSGQMTPTMLKFLQLAVDTYKLDETCALVLALLDVLQGIPKDPGWVTKAIVQLSYLDVKEPSAALAMAFRSLSLVSQFPQLSGSIIRFYAQVPVSLQARAIQSKLSVLPVEYLPQMEIGPLASCLASANVQQALSMGLAANAGRVSPHLVEPLYPYLVLVDPEFKLILVRSVGTDVLGNPSPKSWTFLRDLCLGVPVPLSVDASESEKIINTLSFAIISVLVYHKVHCTANQKWIPIARDELMGAHSAKPNVNPEQQSLWHSVSARVMELWGLATDLPF